DGICCSYGSGSYTVTDEFGNILASGASFGSSDGGNFCVSGGGPQPTCDDGVQNGDETGIDCGGSCAACETCDDGIQNGDETGIDCGGSCAPCETGPCTYGVVNNATFEGGWGIWNDGGTDCRRSRQDRAYANGTFCVRLQDNTSTSVTYTDNLNLAGYEELTVSFRFTAESMETGKDFWLQISTNGGASFTTVASYFSGSDFVNGPVYTSEVVVPGPFTSSTVVQFRNDGGNNGDRVYLDDIEISGCVVGGRWTDAVPDMADADAVVGSPFQALNLYPNPAQDVVQLDFVLAENVRFEWGVLDLLGRQLMAEQRTAQSGEQRLKLPVSDWPEGTYILYLRSEFGLESKRFIIQR
ncbi:MAG: T9SS type A sorting domain-containing protein, partial [Flavobacteriales bacterium]